MVEPSAYRYYAGLVLAEAVVAALVALLWWLARRRLEGRPPLVTFSRLHPEPPDSPASLTEASPGSSSELPPSDILSVLPPVPPAAARQASGQIGSIVSAARALILKEVPVSREFPYKTFIGPVLGFRLSESPHDGFCSVVTYRDCVHLVFHRGAELPDDYGSLQGSTAHARYLELRSPTDLHTTGARRHIREALQELVQRRPAVAPHAVPRAGPAA